MKMISKVLGTVVVSLYFSPLLSLVVGSDSVVSLESLASFPSVDYDNEIRSFALMKNGFSLEDALTTCTFRSIFPVSGTVNVSGGNLFLGSDLLFQNVATLASMGKIFGDYHTIDLSSSIQTLPGAYNSVFQNTNIFLNTDLTISGTAKFVGNCLLDGRWNNVILDTDATIVVGHDSSLILRNLELNGINAQKITCLDDSSRIVLDNVRWVQSGDYTFTRGSLSFNNQVNFVGPYNFIYDSPLTSTINSDSMWYLSDVVSLTIGRKNGIFSREPIFFPDSSAILKLENCTVVVTSSGMGLTRGTILIDREVFLDIKSTSTRNALIMGDGNAAHDISWQLYPAAAIKITNGHFVNDVAQKNNFGSGDVPVKFVLEGDSVFYSKQDVHFDNIEIDLYGAGSALSIPGKTFYREKVSIKTPIVEFSITGTDLGPAGNLLAGDNQISLISGVFPLATYVARSGNSINGVGDIVGPISLQNGSADLTFNFDGQIGSDVAMNGGKIVLGRDVKFARDSVITGSGICDLTSHSLGLILYDRVWSSTLLFKGLGANIVLGSNFGLTSELSFSGYCLIDGNGNELVLHKTANLIVKDRSTLHLKNMTISGLEAQKIRCQNDSATIVLDNVHYVLSNNYSFTQGNMYLVNDVACTGSATFSYESKLTSTLAAHSHWDINDGLRLSIGRSSATTLREPLYFSDITSELGLNGCFFSINKNGMRITRGTIIANRDVAVEVNSTSSTNGLITGNHNLADDPQFIWGAGAVVRFPKGHFSCEAVNPYTMKTRGSGAHVVIDSLFNFYLNENLTFPDFQIDFSPLGWGFTIAPGKTLSYKNTTLSLPGTQFSLTGKRYNVITTLLDGNAQALTLTGYLPLNTLVKGSGNSINGFGGVAGQITLQDGGSQLSMGIGGAMLNNIVMAGSKVTLAGPIVFADDKMFTGSGTVNINTRYINIGGLNLNATSTLLWDCNQANIILRANVPLSGTWTFSGKCTFLGANNALILGPTGRLIIERGSSVVFKNLILQGLGDGRVWCKDNAGRLVLDNTTWLQDSNFSFSSGRFDVVNNVIMVGSNKVFSYLTPMQSTIKSRAKLSLDQDFTFSYAPISPGSGLLSFADATSKLTMNGATLHSTATGLQLIVGTLEVKGNCAMSSDARIKSNGIIIGDGVSSANNCYVDIYPESSLNLLSGYIVYNNI